MHRNIRILLLFLLPFSCLFGQEGKVLTIEIFVCDSAARPIKDVAIYDTENRLRSVTNREGMARVATRQDEGCISLILDLNGKFFVWTNALWRRLEKSRTLQSLRFGQSPIPCLRSLSSSMHRIWPTKTRRYGFRITKQGRKVFS